MPLYTLPDLAHDLNHALSAGPAIDLEAGAVALRRLLAHPDDLSRYVDLLERARGPWLLYQDPAHGYLVTLLSKPAGQTTNLHHHGEAWSLYGVLDGEEVVHRYTRTDAGDRPGQATLRFDADHLLRLGDVEVEPAYSLHHETSGAAKRTVAVAIRGADTARITHEYFDLQTGAITTRLGNPALPLPDDHR